MTASVEFVKAVAWPVVIAFIVLRFRGEIARLIDRVFKFKGFGMEVEAAKQEVDLALENVRAAIPKEIKDVKAAVEISKAKGTLEVTGTATAKGDTPEIDRLMKLAETDARGAIRQSWEHLAKAVYRAAKMSPGSVDPTSLDFIAALEQLKSNGRFSESLIRAIKNLQIVSRKVFLHSEWAYMPSQPEAQDFVLYSAASRTELGDKVE